MTTPTGDGLQQGDGSTKLQSPSLPDSTKPQPSNRRLTIFVTLFAAGVFILGAVLLPTLIQGQERALQSVSPLVPPSYIHFPAPQLELNDLQGNPVTVQAFQGKVILVNNWATWCPPCVAEMPELEAYYAAHATSGFVLLAIDAGDPASQVASFVKAHGLTFRVWLDPEGKSQGFFKNWDLPSSYVIDRLGTVRLTWTGGVSLATLEKYVTPLLEGEP